MATSAPLPHYTGPWFSYPTAAQVVAAGSVFILLNVVVVPLRFLVRSRQKGEYGLDDCFTVPALVRMFTCVCLGYCANLYSSWLLA